MAGNPDISALLIGCGKADRESQKKFYTLYYGYAMATCRRYAMNEVEALEMVNGGFLRIFRMLSLFHKRFNDDEVAVRRLVKEMMINAAVDQFNKLPKSLDVIMRNEGGAQQNEQEQELIGSKGTISYEDIDKILHQLPPMHRMIFNLYIIDGYKHKEIARLLNITVDTSKSKLQEATQFVDKIYANPNLQ